MHSGELAHERTRTLDQSLLVDPEESDRPVVDFLRATPGRMALVAVVLVAALLVVGVTASKTVSDRQGRLETLRSHTEPLADAAQRIYGALSIRQHDRGHRVPVRRRRTARRPRSLRRRHRTGVRRPGHRLERSVAQRYSLADAAHRHLQPAGGVHRDCCHCPGQQPRRSPDRSRIPQRIVGVDAAGHPAGRRTVVRDSIRCRHRVGTLRRSVSCRDSGGRRSCWCCWCSRRRRWLGAAIVGSTPVWCWRRY